VRCDNPPSLHIVLSVQFAGPHSRSAPRILNAMPSPFLSILERFLVRSRLEVPYVFLRAFFRESYLMGAS